MGLLAINRATHRVLRHAAGLLLVLVLSGAVAAHHGGIAVSSEPHHDDVGAVAELCFAVVAVVGAAVAAIAIGLLALGRWRRSCSCPWSPANVAAAGSTNARAGPARLSVLCCWRR